MIPIRFRRYLLKENARKNQTNVPCLTGKIGSTGTGRSMFNPSTMLLDDAIISSKSRKWQMFDWLSRVTVQGKKIVEFRLVLSVAVLSFKWESEVWLIRQCSFFVPLKCCNGCLQCLNKPAWDSFVDLYIHLDLNDDFESRNLVCRSQNQHFIYIFKKCLDTGKYAIQNCILATFSFRIEYLYSARTGQHSCARDK